MYYMSYYNNRNSLGKFTRRLAVKRDSNGKFISPFDVVNGRLYGYKQIPVRAHKLENGHRLISFHKTLFGFCKDEDLTKINIRKVKNYLAEA